MQQRRDDRSLGELFGELAQETGRLVHQELSLARAEIAEKAGTASRNLVNLAVGGLVAYAGFLAFLAAVIAAMSNVMPWWLAALLVAVFVGLVGYLIVRSSLAALKRENLTPRQTIRTIKENADWAKEQVQ